MRDGYILKQNHQKIKKDGKHLQDIFQLKLQQNQDHSVISAHLHKNIHVCLCCYESDWHELEYVRRRVSKQDNSDPDQLSYGAYKSQKYRYEDIQ